MGTYTLRRKLGQGAYAEVWLAVQEGGTLGFRKKVALKLVRPGKADDEDEVQAFLREASLVANLRHPNIVDTLSVSEEGGTLHIAMEFVDGGTLHELVNRCLRNGLSIPNSVVCQLLIDIARGLSAAHDAEDVDGMPLKVIHRDLKLGNVLLDKTGVAKVADFGMAKAAGDMTATATGFVKGTPAYVAPEVWEGAREFTPGVDLFAVGCIAYSLVTRRRLFDGENVASIYGQICKRTPDQEAAPIGDKYPGLAPIAEKLLQRDPTDRYLTASALANDLVELSRRTPAAGETRDFLWLLHRIEANESDEPAAVPQESMPFKLPERADAGWAVAIERALGTQVEVLPFDVAGGEAPPEPDPEPAAAPAQSEPPDSGGPGDIQRGAASAVLKTELLPPRRSKGASLKTDMDFSMVDYSLEAKAPEQLAPKKKATPTRRKLKRTPARKKKKKSPLVWVILVLAGVLAVVVGLIVAQDTGADPEPEADAQAQTESTAPPASPPDLVIPDDAPSAVAVAPESAASSAPEATPAPPSEPEEAAEPTPEAAPAPEVAPTPEAADPTPAPQATPAPAEPAPAATACLVISATPRGTKVWLDGEELGRKAGEPAGLTVSPGAHTVGMGSVSTPSVEQAVTVPAGGAVGVHCTLTGDKACSVTEAAASACG